MKATTQQVGKVPKPHPNGSLPNPTGKGGFSEHPENQSPGGWKKENTISYQYNRFINMSPQQLKDFGKEPDENKTMAMVLAFGRVMAAKKSLPDIKEITDRTEGRAAQSMDLTTNGKDLPTPILGGIGDLSGDDSSTQAS